jgi:hypothetical protein
MSKIGKSKGFTQNASHTHFVTIMLSKIFLGEKRCDDIFFHILRKRLKNKMSGNNMETFGNNFVAKNRKQYSCNNCYYITSNKFDYDKHCKTMKHQIANLSTKINENDDIIAKKSPDELSFVCCCGKTYKERSGIWKHRKKCEFVSDDMDTGLDNDKHMIKTLIKDNAELKNLIIKVIAKDTLDNSNHNPIINNSHNTNNSHNKTFNLSVYLNETCKDAINIGDFVSSIKVQLEDLEHTGRVGYIEGVSNIIIKNLNNLENHMRPLHCSDFKREVLYIKNNNEWTKEADSKPILTRAIKTIANENIKKISEWKKEHPDCTSADSKKNNLYLKIVSNSMNGLTKEEGEHNINKIISNIAKETIIQKDKL